MVKLNLSLTALSKKRARQRDRDATLAAQAEKDARFQLQRQQYQQWQLQQQQEQQQAEYACAQDETSIEESQMVESNAISVETSTQEDEVRTEKEFSLTKIFEDRDTFLGGVNNTYTEEESLVSDDEENTSVDSSDDEDTYYRDDAQLKDATSYDDGVSACEATGNQKKYFHKDVMVPELNAHSDENDLGIRTMYSVPKPKNPEDVVVRIEVSTVSARDVMYCHGVGLRKKMLPFVPGFEIIGAVHALGESARARGMFREGQRVAGFSLNGGGNSRFISIPGNRLFHISRTITSTHAVCLIHDYVTALKALRLAKRGGSAITGMKILITDGFSAVGQAIISLAKREGASIYCCADMENHAYLASLGTKCFEKAPETWLPRNGGTFDVVIDNSCLDSYNSSWFALNQRGTLVCVSPVINFNHPRDIGCGVVHSTELLQKWAEMKAKYMMPQTYFIDTLNDFDTDREQYFQDMKYLTFLLKKGEIIPKIAEEITIEDVSDAQRLIYNGQANGTIVCVPWLEN